jgi:sugar O-acyltransferase (sialic acid O-acetyltransferase NeuD family)
MNNIAIYGAGGFGKEIACLINLINNESNTWNLIGYFDDNSEKKFQKFNNLDIIGGIEDLNKFKEPLSIIFSIGNPSIIQKIYKKIYNNKISYPNILSPDCIFLDQSNFNLGKGNIIMPQSLISCNVTIGDFNLMNCGTSIGHDSKIGSFNSFMSYSKISGEVKIGDSNYFGACSLVLQQKKIGNNTVIGASSVIMRNTEDENSYLGNPAVKILKPKIK